MEEKYTDNPKEIKSSTGWGRPLVCLGLIASLPFIMGQGDCSTLGQSVNDLNVAVGHEMLRTGENYHGRRLSQDEMRDVRIWTDYSRRQGSR